jgi:hypothetical protein
MTISKHTSGHSKNRSRIDKHGSEGSTELSRGLRLRVAPRLGVAGTGDRTLEKIWDGKN